MNRGTLTPLRTVWHITVGTYCSRLHGDKRPTVDRLHNQRGTPFVGPDPDRARHEREIARGEPVRLSDDQRRLIERIMPELCARGGWTLHACAAPPPPENDHFHVVLDADGSIHGKQIRRWLKRWLTESLDAAFGRPEGGSWWAEGGSTKPVKDDAYFANVIPYVRGQRTMRDDET